MFRNHLHQITDLATLTMFLILWEIISSLKNPRPQSGARTNRSLSMYLSASSTLFSISSTDSIADLATLITPKITFDCLKCGSSSLRSLHASASSMENYKRKLIIFKALFRTFGGYIAFLIQLPNTMQKKHLPGLFLLCQVS